MKANKKPQSPQELKKENSRLKRELRKYQSFFYCAVCGDEPQKYKKQFEYEISLM